MRQFIQKYFLVFGAVMSMAFVSVLSVAVMMASVGTAEGATITAKAGVGGMIDPSGTITVKNGAAQQFRITVSSGYTIISVTGCNGTLSKTSSGYVYSVFVAPDVRSCTVTASFKLVVPKILSFSINGNAATETITQSVTLNFSTVTGSMPTHYRASERADFAGTVWNTLAGITSFIRYELSGGAGSKTVYLQLKDSATGNVSNVMSDTINLQARQLYNISGHEFYTAATSAGFVSRARALAGCSCVIIEGPADNLQANQVSSRVVGGDYCRSDVANPACEFTFFDRYAPLSHDFVFKSLSGFQSPPAGGCGYDLESTPPVGSTSVRFKLEGWTYGNTVCQYIINQITLEGPANADWRTGLRP